MTLEKYDILNRYTNDVQFTAEIEVTSETSDARKKGLAVIWVLENGFNLRDTNLSRANLSRADLSGADLSGADMKRLTQLEKSQ